MSEQITHQQLKDLGKDLRADYRAASFQDVLGDFSQKLEASHQEGFQKRQTPAGVPWPPWQLRTPDAADNHPTLEVSGKLRASLRKGGAKHVKRVNKFSLTWGTKVEYAAIHQHGAEIVTGVPLVPRGGKGYIPVGTRVRIPQREFVGMTEGLLDTLADAVADAVVEALKGRS